MVIERDGAIFSLDTPEAVRVSGTEFYLRGWFLPRKGFERAQRLIITLDGIDLPIASGLPRADVAKSLKRTDALNCGFLCRFKAPSTARSIRLVLQSVGSDFELAKMQFDAASPATDMPMELSWYRDWLDRYEAELFWPENEVTRRLAALLYRPKMSILVPVFDAHPYLLSRCIGSILKQQYVELEAFIIGTHINSDALRFLQDSIAEDDRFRLILSDDCEMITDGLNRALRSAEGEFVVLMQQDGELHSSALLEVVRDLNSGGDADLVYSDEDRVDFCGHRSQPLCKPRFDPDLLLASNYIGYMAAARRDVALAAGGFRPAGDDTGYWDFLLRVVDSSTAGRVGHIAKPLYHRRYYDELTRGGLDPEPLPSFRFCSGLIYEHLQRTNEKQACVEPGYPEGFIRVRYQHRENVPVAIVVRELDGNFQENVLKANIGKQSVSFYSLRECLLTPFAESGKPARQGSVFSLSEMGEEVFLFVSRPLESVNHAFIDELVAQAMRKDCGVVSGLSIDEERTIVHSGLLRAANGELVDRFAGWKFPIEDYTIKLFAGVRNVDAISEHFFAVRREHLSAVGGLASCSASQMPRLVGKLCHNAHEQGLRVRVTPYAVAMFENIEPLRSDRPTDACGLINVSWIWSCQTAHAV